MAKKAAAKKKATRKAAIKTVEDAAPAEATEKKQSVAARIREYRQANPEAKAKDVVEALLAEGLKVSLSQYYQAFGKKKAKGAKRGPKPGSKKASHKTHESNGFAGGQIEAAAALIKVSGSVDAAISALQAIKSILGSKVPF